MSDVLISRDDLLGVYEYALHFDVEDDPLMVRVKAALDGSAPIEPAAND